jgi:hypothetical protein
VSEAKPDVAAGAIDDDARQGGGHASQGHQVSDVPRFRVVRGVAWADHCGEQVNRHACDEEGKSNPGQEGNLGELCTETSERPQLVWAMCWLFAGLAQDLLLRCRWLHISANVARATGWTH